MSRCKSCDAEIFWVTMDESGKKMPVDADGKGMALIVHPDKTRGRFVQTWESHFVTCPNAAAHRKAKDFVETLTPEATDDEANP